jgi:Ser/Thr protein kinase RdoA (MazF antagonist)
MAIEEPLAGGNDNRGQVLRIGDTVRRPPRDFTRAVRALLLHLERCGFEGAPRYLDTDDQGREVLTFVEGHVPLPPYPAWSMSDDALDSFGELVRRFHDAAASFDATAVSGWHLDWADPLGGSMVCHNDLCPENVVFRDGRAVALIDFDMAAPGRPFWDLANATQEWMPLQAPETRRDHELALDAVARFGRLARAYGVDANDAVELVDVVFAKRAHAIANIRHMVEIGNPVWIELWPATGGDERAAIDDAWLAEQRDALIAAVT